MTFFIYFLDDQRNSDNQVRFLPPQSLHDNFGRRRFTEQGDMSSDSSCSQKVESATVGVCQWQKESTLSPF